MSVRVTLCPTCGKQTGMYESGRSDSIAANKCECHPPTDPTPTPREVLAAFAEHAMDVARSGWNCGPISPDGTEVVACERDYLAALAATGDAPLSGEEVERAAREIVDDLFPDYRHADGGVGRSYQNMVIERLTSALGSVRPILCGTLAAQLAALRAERDRLAAELATAREKADGIASALDDLAQSRCTDGFCELGGRATGMHTNGGCHCLVDVRPLTVRRGLLFLLRQCRALATPARPTDTGRDG